MRHSWDGFRMHKVYGHVFSFIVNTWEYKGKKSDINTKNVNRHTQVRGRQTHTRGHTRAHARTHTHALTHTHTRLETLRQAHANERRITQGLLSHNKKQIKINVFLQLDVEE